MKRHNLGLHPTAYSFTPKPAATKSFFSDASQLACAAHSGDGKLIAHRMFTELGRAESSTFRELAAIKFALEAFEPALHHSNVKWFTDSQSGYLSKIIDYDDWEITPQLFRLLEGKFGPHTVDCFADYNNCKVQKFYSRFWNPGSAGIDAFFHSWEGENALLVPPVLLASRVLKFMHSCKAQRTFVVFCLHPGLHCICW